MSLVVPDFTMLPEAWPRPCPMVTPAVAAVLFTGSDGTLYIPFIGTNDPGNGHVGRYLDMLPADQRIIFVLVASPILDGMLARRGFSLVQGMSLAIQERNPIIPCRVRESVVSK